MKRIALPLPAVLWMAAAQAAPDPGGRWEGTAEIPGSADGRMYALE